MQLIGNMKNNRLIIAAAGSGKTTFLVDNAKKIKTANVLITTYTSANEEEIKRKFKGYTPDNITIQKWFSFLLQHGVRPYQSVMNDELHERKIGFYLAQDKSGYRYSIRNKPIYWGEKDFFNFYFTKKLQIYSDKISKFIIECNKKTNGVIINRISKIYPYIFIDEIQDLAGWELEILKLLFNSGSKILLVGDPRQVTYLTHHSPKYKKYKDGKIKEFIENECNKKKKLCNIDEYTLQKSHRNNKFICDFSSKLYPDYPVCKPCDCENCRNEDFDHQGIYLVKSSDVEFYCKKYNPQKLFYHKAIFPDLNFGYSKGLSFNRILIYPTAKIKKYLKHGNITMIESIKAKFYVALTRAKYSVGIVYDYDNNSKYIAGLKRYHREEINH